MKPAGFLLDLPVQTAARALALVQMERAVGAAGRLRRGEADAVRSLRVALRRLRRTLRDFQPFLSGAASRGKIRPLRRLAAAAGPVRDLEAQLCWLRVGRCSDTPAEAAAREWLLMRVERRHASALRRLRRTAERDLRRLQRRLEPKLQRYTLRVDPGELRPGRSTREVVAALLEQRAARLRACLERVHASASREEVHRARREARRLRDLLQPFRDGIEGGAEVVGALRMLLDQLDDLRDGEIFRDLIVAELEGGGEVPEAAQAGTSVLLDQLERRGEIALGQLGAAWLGSAANPFFARLRQLAAEVRGAGPEREIERKFLLREMPPLPPGAEPLWIEQGWLPGERLRERLRRSTTRDGSRWYRTVKLGSGVQRVEVEEETTPEVFDVLWPLTEGRRVRKQRFRVPVGDRVWEIDRFADRDLVLAEVELDAPDDPVSLPAWLEPVVVREVTDDPAYVNANMAM